MGLEGGEGESEKNTSRALVKLASITGQVKVVHSDLPVKSIELQLVRVETCGA